MSNTSRNRHQRLQPAPRALQLQSTDRPPLQASGLQTTPRGQGLPPERVWLRVWRQRRLHQRGRQLRQGGGLRVYMGSESA